MQLLKVISLSIFIMVAFPIMQSRAANWSSTELHLQYGELDAPSFVGGGSSDTTIVTFQHASGWGYGDHFFFVDFLNDDSNNNFNDSDLYFEYYGALSFSKMLQGADRSGLIKDISAIYGINVAPSAKSVKYLPGVRLSWSLPHFTFFDTLVTAYMDDGKGLSGNGAPKEDNSFMIDFVFKLPFTIADKHRFSIEGHGEYIKGRDTEVGRVSDWILLQPQLRYDLGKQMANTEECLYVGFEYQYWRNKLGDANTDESVLQLLLVWRL